MGSTRRILCAGLAAVCVSLAGEVRAADLLRDVDEAYARRGVARPALDVRDLEPAEGRFLAQLFSLTDEAVLLNTEAMRWFVSNGERGLHPAVHLERIDAVRARLGALEAPERVASVKALLVECLGLQRGFVSDWSEAIAEGRPFESQLTHE
jgi:hypothetical protein